VKKDPHATEPKVELNRETYRLYVEALDNSVAWKKEAERLQGLLNEEIGDAYAGTVNGHKVVTHRPIQTWRINELVRDYPELTARYVEQVTVEKLDIHEFRAHHKEIADKYQSRSFRNLGPGEEVDLA
jgi:hypothetical protein